MEEQPLSKRPGIGEPAPWFFCPTRGNPRFAFDSVAGRFVVLSFLGAASAPEAQALVEAVRSARRRFNGRDLAFFGVSTDAADADHPLLKDAPPGITFFQDFDGRVTALYGAERRMSYVLDPALRVLGAFPVTPAGIGSLMTLVDRLPAMGAPTLARPQAPVLVLPRVFEPSLCRELVAYYERLGGKDSGFMREVNGMTKGIIDHAFKRRRDRLIQDEALRRTCLARIERRLLPEIEKAFQYRATRMERYLVACYDAAERGHFQAHRDNNTKGTAHRRFAVSLFLNTGEYEGGYLRFPEFGNALYSAPAGGAVVFGCGLLHEATAVTRGRRYMFLPFLYDEAGARLRAQNARYVDTKSTRRARGETEQA